MTHVPAILVVGATGTVGSELSRLLAAGGARVRRASREAAGEGRVRLDVLSGDGVAAAFAGTDSAFLLAPPGHVDQDRLLVPLIEAARAAGTRKVVLMTAMGADASDALPMRKAELALIGSGLAWNVIRPNWFMQNFATFWLHDIVASGAIRLPVGRARGSFIDARDVAGVAARLLADSAFDGHAFDLTGPRALDHDEAAAILSRASGRTIGFETIAPAAMLDGLLAAGIPRPYAEFLLAILDRFDAGDAGRTTDAVARITSAAPRTFERYAEEHRAVWAGR